MAETRRYRTDRQAGTPRGRDPFRYAEGIRTPSAPNIPMPPSPAGAPPGPPRIYEPRITPAQAQAEGSAKIQSQLATTLNNWGNRFAEKAAVEAKQAGQSAGISYGDSAEKLELRGGTNIYDVNFDRSARNAYTAKTQIDIEQRLNTLALENPTNLEIFKAKGNALVTGFLGQISDPETAQRIKHYATSRMFQHETSINKNAYALHHENSKAALEENLNLIIPQITQALSQNDATAAASLQEAAEKLIEDLVTAGVLTPAQAGIKKEQFRKSSVKAFIVAEHKEKLHKGDKDENGRPLAEIYFENIVKNGINGLNEDDIDQIIDKINQDIRDVKNATATKRAQDQAIRLIKEKESAKILEAGREKAQTGKAPISADVIAMMTPDQQAKARQYNEDYQTVFEFGLNSLEQQLLILQEFANSPDLKDVETFKLLQARHDVIEKMIENGDGITLARQLGFIDDLGTIENLNEQNVRDRRRAAKELSSIYNKYISPLTERETEALSNQYAGLTIDQKLGFAVSLVNQFGPTITRAFNKKIKVGQYFGVITDLVANEEIAVAKDLVKGQALLPEIKIFTNNQDIELEVIDKILELFPDDETGIKTKYLIDAAEYILKARNEFTFSNVIKNISADEIVTLIEDEILGGVITLNAAGEDYKILPLERGTTDAEFNEKIKNLTVTDINDMGVLGGGIMDPEKLLQDIKDYKYRLVLVPRQGGYALYQTVGQHKDFPIPDDDNFAFILRLDTGDIDIDNEPYTILKMREDALSGALEEKIREAKANP